MDDCSDDTGRLVCAMEVKTLKVSFQNVGKARATGAEKLLSAGAQCLAFTDADSVVPPIGSHAKSNLWLTQCAELSKWIVGMSMGN